MIQSKSVIDPDLGTNWDFQPKLNDFHLTFTYRAPTLFESFWVWHHGKIYRGTLGRHFICWDFSKWFVQDSNSTTQYLEKISEAPISGSEIWEARSSTYENTKRTMPRDDEAERRIGWKISIDAPSSPITQEDLFEAGKVQPVWYMELWLGAMTPWPFPLNQLPVEIRLSPKCPSDCEPYFGVPP